MRWPRRKRRAYGYCPECGDAVTACPECEHVHDFYHHIFEHEHLCTWCVLGDYDDDPLGRGPYASRRAPSATSTPTPTGQDTPVPPSPQ